MPQLHELFTSVGNAELRRTNTRYGHASNDEEEMFLFVMGAVKKQYLPAEMYIARVPLFSFRYAKEILKRPWPPGEEAISKDDFLSLLYAQEVIRGPWTRGEEAISKDALSAFYYSIKILKKPWPRGENIIKTSKYYSPLYETFKATYEHPDLNHLKHSMQSHLANISEKKLQDYKKKNNHE